MVAEAGTTTTFGRGTLASGHVMLTDYNSALTGFKIMTAISAGFYNGLPTTQYYKNLLSK